MFLGVKVQDKEDAGWAVIKDIGITYLNGWDTIRKVAVDYGVWGIPEAFFIDREGRITYKYVGAVEWGTITAKLGDALQGIVSTEEGRGNYQSVR
ncbi:MAG: hypothetical protein V3T23_06315 [Nitrososphaerales archaeon]